MDFIRGTPLFHILPWMWSLRGFLSKSLKQSGFVSLSQWMFYELWGCWRESVFFCLFCFLQLSLNIFFIVTPPYCCCSSRLSECLTLHLCLLQIVTEFVFVFSQAAFSPWISGSMVHPWWNPHVLPTCQHCKSVRQFDVLILQTESVKDHKKYIKINTVNKIQWYMDNFCLLTMSPCCPTLRSLRWAMIVLVF